MKISTFTHRLHHIRRPTLSLLLAVVLLSHVAIASAAYNALEKRTPFYDPDVVLCAKGGGAVTLHGNTNAERAYNYFLSKDPDLKPFQVAAIIGNLTAESGVNPEQIQIPPGGETKDPSGLTTSTQGWGIMQWTPGSKTPGLMQQAGITTPVYELGSQLELVWWHFNNTAPPGEQNVYPGFKATTDISQATFYFQKHMEAPTLSSPDPKRIELANEALQEFGGNPPGSTPVIPTGQCGGTTQGLYALPIDKKFFDENPQWLTAPHHDHPASDLPVPTGTIAYAMTSGKLIDPHDPGECGRGVMLDAGNGVVLIYCHGLDGGSYPNAHFGDTVTAGQPIMTTDNTGHSTGPHLHVGIRINGVDRCPQPLFVGIVSGSPPDIMSLPSSGCTN